MNYPSTWLVGNVHVGKLNEAHSCRARPNVYFAEWVCASKNPCKIMKHGLLPALWTLRSGVSHETEEHESNNDSSVENTRLNL
jgi:hypothetical protein